jgi:hypothetical protein
VKKEICKPKEKAARAGLAGKGAGPLNYCNLLSNIAKASGKLPVMSTTAPGNAFKADIQI